MGVTCKERLWEERCSLNGRGWEEECHGRGRFYKLECRSGLLRNESDVTAGDAEVVQFTCGQAVQFRDCVTITAPVIVRADQVHFTHLKFFCLLDRFRSVSWI